MFVTEIHRSPSFSGRPHLRLAKNLANTPKRILNSLKRLFSGAYAWERRVCRELEAWLSDERQSELDAIEGTSSLKECQLLAWLASIAPAGGCIVEIGAWKGRSTAWLVEGAQQHSPPLKTHSIDPHMENNWDDFQKVVTKHGLESKGLTVHRAFSHEVGVDWTAPISLLWIDGDHEYEGALQDIVDFTPHVIHNGWIVFDDAAGGHFPGVERAIAEKMTNQNAFRHVATLRHLQIFQKN